MGNETTEEHKTYLAFLDSIFSKIKTENINDKEAIELLLVKLSSKSVTR